MANKLDRCKEKGNAYAKEHIKEIQDIYKQEDQRVEQLIIANKEKQWKQDKEVLFYKLYDISLKSSKPEIPKLMFIQDEIKNLDKYIKYIQSPIKTMLFYPPPHYKFIWPQEEWDE